MGVFIDKFARMVRVVLFMGADYSVELSDSQQVMLCMGTHTLSDHPYYFKSYLFIILQKYYTPTDIINQE